MKRSDRQLAVLKKCDDVQRNLVWVTAIEHKHGTNFYVHKSNEGAVQCLRDYCAEWWEEAWGPQPPDDRIVAEYFGNHGWESYVCDQATLED